MIRDLWPAFVLIGLVVVVTAAFLALFHWGVI
jgi:hypothetical protein